MSHHDLNLILHNDFLFVLKMSTRKFKIISQPMDGNCFYHSVCYLLKHYNINEITHDELRNKVVTYLNKRKKNIQLKL